MEQLTYIKTIEVNLSLTIKTDKNILLDNLREQLENAVNNNINNDLIGEFVISIKQTN
jgi:hypothetical protein